MKWLIVIALSLASCSSTYPLMHYAVAQNVPLLTQKNELRLSAASGTETFGVQAAYAFSKSFGVMGSYSDGLDDMGYSGNGSRWSGEFAVGYFKTLKDSIIIEIYGGAGRYHRDFQAWNDALAGSLPPDTFRTNCTEPFVQFDLGFKSNGHHSFSLSGKFGYLIYDHFYSFHAGAAFGPTYSTTNHASTTPTTAFCLTYRLGGKRLSFQAQAGLSTQVPASYYDTDGDFFVNLGLSLKLFGEQKTSK